MCGGASRGSPELVPAEGIEPPTFGLQNRCSTAELSRRTNDSGHLGGRLGAATPKLAPEPAYHRSLLVRNAASMAATAALSSLLARSSASESTARTRARRSTSCGGDLEIRDLAQAIEHTGPLPHPGQSGEA